LHLSIHIENVQHIKELNYEIDLSSNGLHCIVGKNGCGKTTLIRSLQNIISADTFQKTASPYIFDGTSKITYKFNDTYHVYSYNDTHKQLDSKTVIALDIKKSLFIEQPIPHGIRFNHTQKLSSIDEELRTKRTLKEYTTPTELIDFLEKIYGDQRFSQLKEVIINREKYYFVLKDNNQYIREDYFSSGEYFIIHLYKLIQKKCSLIAIDELDISLDASAQVNLVQELRVFCKSNEVNIVFTTHSLALMKTLNQGHDKLFYMDNNKGNVSTTLTSYNYIKSLLFGFKGWDKYILVEDEMLKMYITYLLRNSNFIYTYNIIYIGGADQVVGLLKRNIDENFLASKTDVIAVLDGDQKNYKMCKNRSDTHFIPQQSVEKEMSKIYEDTDLGFEVEVTGKKKNYDKNLVAQIIKKGHLRIDDIFGIVTSNFVEETNELVDTIVSFLTPPPQGKLLK